METKIKHIPLRWAAGLALVLAAGAAVAAPPVGLASAGSTAGAPPAALPAPAAPGAAMEPFEEADLPMPDPDLWHRIRKGFLLIYTNVFSKRFDETLVEYSTRKRFIIVMLDRLNVVR